MKARVFSAHTKHVDKGWDASLQLDNTKALSIVNKVLLEETRGNGSTGHQVSYRERAAARFDAGPSTVWGWWSNEVGVLHARTFRTPLRLLNPGSSE